MKRFNILPLSAAVLVATLVTIPAHAQQINCAQPTFNFGSKDNSGTVKHTFVISNDGDATLNISRVKPACGCTVANISSKVLAPGETAEITASLNLKGRRGMQTKPMTVYSNDPNKPQYKLTLTGTAISEVGLSPTALSLGRLDEGKQITKDITLTNNGANPLKIVKVEAVNNLVTHEVVTVEEGKKYVIKVTNSGNVPPGRLSDNIVITTDNPKALTHRVPVYGTIIDKLSITPNPMILTESAVPVNRVIYVRAGSVKNFQVTGASWDAAGVPGRIANLGASGFTVTFPSVKADTALNGSKIVVNTDVPDMPTVEVPVTVRAAARPAVPGTKPGPRPPVASRPPVKVQPSAFTPKPTLPARPVPLTPAANSQRPLILPAKPVESAPALPSR